ncbi:MAG: amidohydrolase [Ilumatobacter sp.]|nr:amidohydrolase [Ilumatobacter sp.]
MSSTKPTADRPPDPQIASIRDQAAGQMDDAVSLRRTLHEWPEIGNELPITRETVAGALDDLPLAITLHETTSGIAALLEGDAPGPTMLLRGDMDALELHEDTGLEFSSRVDEAMHACGHDTHTAMLVGAARVLAERRGEIAGRVLFMFQPGEEGHHGARFMLDEGLLDVPPMSDGSESTVESAFALHITSALPAGWIGTRGGPVMASADRVQIRITGKGGHASEPFRAVDPIPVACEIVTALQAMVTRSIDVFDPSVVTIGRIVAGTTNNVIPETAEIDGTIRAVSERTRAKVHDGIKRVAENIAAAHGCDGDVEIIYGYPVTTNDDQFAEWTLDLADEVAGAPHVVRLPHPVMGAEDFSYVLNELPGSMSFLGGTPLDRDLAKAAPNHSNRVYFDEGAMETGISLYAAAALRRLAPS